MLVRDCCHGNCSRDVKMGGSDWFKIGLKLFGPIIVQSIKYNGLVR